jgi:hypothetical protein
VAGFASVDSGNVNNVGAFEVESGKLSNWLQIQGNVGLIAGLVLVAVQIQENTDATKAQMASEGFATNVALKLAVVGENASSALSKAIDRPDALTTEEMVVLTNLQEANFLVRARNEWIDDLGYGVSTLLNTAEGNAAATVWEYLDTPFGLAWWQEVKGGMWLNIPKTTAQIEHELAAQGPQVGIQAASEIASLRAAIATFQSSSAETTDSQ